MGIKVAMGWRGTPDAEWLAFAKQAGVEGVILHIPELPGDQRWEYEDLVSLRKHIESHDLRLFSLENTPWSFYEDAMVGGPRRDQQIENYQATIRNIGKAGLDVLGFCWMPNSVWSTSFETKGRGGSLSRSFNLAEVEDTPPTHGRTFDEDEMWSHFSYFMNAVLPVAEESDVRLALHPDDPPVPMLGGVARIFAGFDGHKRALEMFDSPNFGLNFCMGTWAEQGPGLVEKIAYFAERQKIVYMHFRDVKGHVPYFEECFLGEGDIDLVEVLVTLKRAGFDGFMEEDHVPAMIGDTGWGHRSRALTSGYMQGLISAVERLG